MRIVESDGVVILPTDESCVKAGSKGLKYKTKIKRKVLFRALKTLLHAYKVFESCAQHLEKGKI